MAAQDHDQDKTGARLRPNRNDPLHDQQLLRALEAVNSRMVREHGLLPPGGLPLQPKCKPQVPRPTAPPVAPPAGRLMAVHSDDTSPPDSDACFFTYYPGISTGYSGFTDHQAMRCDVNNWLLKEADDMQYWLAGFGAGFVQAAMHLCKDECDATRRLKVNSGDSTIIESVNVLQRLQLSGVDTGSPSTANLADSLEDIFKRLENEGPIRREYWTKRDEEDSPAVDEPLSRAEKLHEARKIGLRASISKI